MSKRIHTRRRESKSEENREKETRRTKRRTNKEEEGGGKTNEARPITKFPWNFWTVAEARATVHGVTIMHARMLIDTWVGRWGARGGGASEPVHESRDISHYAFLSGGRHYFTYCRRRRTDCLCQFFQPGKKERPAIWSAACAHASPCTGVPLTAFVGIQPFALRSRFLPTGLQLKSPREIIVSL